MSTIESAFIKTLEKSKNKSSATPSNETENIPANNVSPRKKISSMSQTKIFTHQELNNKRLISAALSDSELLNEFRNLRTNLLAKNPTSNFVTLITSIVPGHKTNLISANLAASFALDYGKTAILIDADVKNSEMNELFEVKPKYGLIDYLEFDERNIEQVLYETPIPRLRYIPSGKVIGHSSEYFTNDRMKEFMEKLISRYPERYPIIDAPSIRSSADTRILIGLCDCIVLVIPYGKCSEEDIKQAICDVGQEKIAGVILDQF